MPASKKNKTTPPPTPQNFPVVGIGASAGGLDAFKQLLKAIPEDSGMAYVLVQHLALTHESMLPEILARVTKLPVNEITDDIHLAPNHIYVIPSAKILTATDGVLKLSERTEKYRNFAIDIFFRSLGEVHKELAACCGYRCGRFCFAAPGNSKTTIANQQPLFQRCCAG